MIQGFVSSFRWLGNAFAILRRNTPRPRSEMQNSSKLAGIPEGEGRIEGQADGSPGGVIPLIGQAEGMAFFLAVLRSMDLKMWVERFVSTSCARSLPTLVCDSFAFFGDNCQNSRDTFPSLDSGSSWGMSKSSNSDQFPHIYA
jgi:hypothetical protein